MADFEEDAGKLTVKVVYYGPAQSGKTTNLMRLHDLPGPQLKGEIMTLETRNDRTLFFDLLPMGLRAPSGLMIKLRLFTVPGQVAHDGTRKAILSRADGVVFVADSHRNQTTNNAESFDNLMGNAARVGLDFARLPLVIQFNKRDLPESSLVPEDTIRADWRQAPWPLVFASALLGSGVRETFANLLAVLYRSLDADFALAERHGLDSAAFVAGLGGVSPAAEGE
ncbi:MAG: GTPase domain-containing protein [Rhodocyclaceae bacterium]